MEDKFVMDFILQRKTSKSIETFICEFIPSFLHLANMDHLFYASPCAPIQSTSVRRTWFLCFKELCNLKDRCVYNKTHCDRCYPGGMYDQGWEAQEKELFILSGKRKNSKELRECNPM